MNKIMIKMDEFDKKLLKYKRIRFSKDYSRIVINYDNPSLHLKKCIFMTPKLLIPFSIREKVYDDYKTYYFNLSLLNAYKYNTDSILKKFCTIINEVDQMNEEIINTLKENDKINKNVIYRKSLYKNNEELPEIFGNIKIPYDDNYGILINIYNYDGKKIDIANLKKKDLVCCCIEASELWVNETECGCTWEVREIQKFKPLTRSQELFTKFKFINNDNIDNELINNNFSSVNNTKFLAKTKTTDLNISVNKNIDLPQKPSLFVPNVAELKEKMMNLKKTTINDKSSPNILTKKK